MVTELQPIATIERDFQNANSLKDRYLAFPENLTYAEFCRLPEKLRMEIAEKNRIIRTDTYNRTMEQIKGNEWAKEETYTLQLRKAPDGYLITYGIAQNLHEILDLPITQAELNFAKDYYANQSNVPYFNAEKWQDIIDNHDGYMPFSIDSVPDGTAVLPGDPVLRVTGPGELVAHFEPDFHRIFYQSLVATHAHEITRKIGPNRFIEVGKRGVPHEALHLEAAAAMYVGGGITLTSSDTAAVALPQLKDTGTIGHRFVQSYESEESAFRAAIEALPAVSLLVDLTDSYRGIDLALALKQEYRVSNKRIWIRLDSGDIEQQTVYILKRQQELGFTDPVLDKVIVEDLETIDDMVRIDRTIVTNGFDPKPFVLYGGGSLLIAKQTSRSDVSTGFKLTRWAGNDTMKFSDTPGKESYPGEPTLYSINGKRVIGQVGEYKFGDIFVPAYRKGTILLPDSIETARGNVEPSFAALADHLASYDHSYISATTAQKIETLKKQYHLVKGGE